MPRHEQGHVNRLLRTDTVCTYSKVKVIDGRYEKIHYSFVLQSTYVVVGDSVDIILLLFTSETVT